MSKVYHFSRHGDEVQVGLLSGSLTFYRPGEVVSDVPLAWGIESDGARILAYSILNDCLGTESAEDHYTQFVKQVLAPLTLCEWRITENQLADFCDYQMTISGMAYQSVIEGMKPSTWNKPTTYQTLPALPSWIVNPNHSLLVPCEESLSKK